MATAKNLGQNLGWSAIAIFGVFLLAVLLRPFQAALVQLLEGYWDDPPLSAFRELAVERHRRIRHTAEIVFDAEVSPAPAATLAELARSQRRQRQRDAMKNRAERIVRRYPTPEYNDSEKRSGNDDRLMPTLLGNVFREGEDAAGQRYGLRLQAVAPRLFPNISPKLTKAIVQSLDLIDTTAALCIAFSVTTAASLPLLVRWDLWSCLVVGNGVLATVAYRGAVRMARSHARLLATAVDLHRFDMLKALHYSLPTTVDEERDFNHRLSDFFDGGRPAADDLAGIEYVHPIGGDPGKTDTEQARPDGA
jgi:hypothetical protein